MDLGSQSSVNGKLVLHGIQFASKMIHSFRFYLYHLLVE